MNKALWGLLIAWAFVGGNRVLSASSWVVVGSFLGDEGKGAVCDFLAQEVDYVVRFNGGNNAGHTLMQHDKTYNLHMLPSGVINPLVVNVIGAGCVVNVAALGEEIAVVEAQLGRPILPHQLVIDMRAG
ncbi:adenylosuccinate synthetase [Candidatus Hepatobacter penaei]|uniref:adenylosuccinate synthetase n=1 Tax=Candidatus Hepatobacter penaei TaxID=1274402 RepID=UPI000695E5CC|nr:adenylosuccinate synthetase [Candidatus Hepatobacter penaei]